MNTEPEPRTREAARKRFFKRTVVPWAVVLMSLLVIYLTFDFLSSARRSWTEDLKLSDGTVVKAYRTSKRSRFGELGGAGGGPVVEESVKFEYQGQTVAWTGDSVALVADVYHGIPYIAMSSGVGEVEVRYGRPNPPYVFFRGESDGWRRINPDEFPNALCRNLLAGRWRIVQSHYTLADKERIDRDGRIGAQPLKRSGKC